MTFLDTNVFMYTVGGSHPLQSIARDFFRQSIRDRRRLCTSAEVLQELAHAYLPVKRGERFDQAMALVRRYRIDVLPLEAEDVLLARQLYERHPHLSARDLCHLATCQRLGITELMTFDGNLAAPFSE